MVIDKLPWAVVVAVADIPDAGLHRDIAPSAAERGAIAAIAGLRELPRLTASFDLSHAPGGQVRVRGSVSADVVQSCVVTLDPVANTIDETVDVRFAEDAGDSPAGGPDTDEALAEDPPEPLINNQIDLGQLAIEFLVLGLDPYPRKPDAVFEPLIAPEDPADHPFAALGALKDKL